MSEENNQSVQLLGVSYNPESGLYSVQIPQGSNAAETAFCMSVIVKVFDRDGIIKKDEFIELIKKYLTDEQYNEVKDGSKKEN